jgi:hypothetical protein
MTRRERRERSHVERQEHRRRHEQWQQANPGMVCAHCSHTHRSVRHPEMNVDRCPHCSCVDFDH